VSHRLTTTTSAQRRRRSRDTRRRRRLDSSPTPLPRSTDRVQLALIEQSVDVLATFDATGACTSLSPRGRRTLGLEPADLDLGAVLGVDRRHLVSTVLPGLVSTRAWAGDLTVESPAGVRCLDARLAADQGRDGRVRGWTLIATDVTAARSAHAELMFRATHDALTGLANRVLLTDRIEQQLAHGAPVEVAFLDLVGFKAVNDTYGHDAGDAALREIARRLEEAVGDAGLAARLGGDEFVIVVPAAWRDAVARLRRAVFAEPVVVAGRQLALDGRFGVASSRRGDTVHDLLVRADRAMYLASAAAAATAAR
jgi:diguanylate cyclase (GGDEF)-like protein